MVEKEILSETERSIHELTYTKALCTVYTKVVCIKPIKLAIKTDLYSDYLY